MRMTTAAAKPAPKKAPAKAEKSLPKAAASKVAAPAKAPTAVAAPAVVKPVAPVVQKAAPVVQKAADVPKAAAVPKAPDGLQKIAVAPTVAKPVAPPQAMAQRMQPAPQRAMSAAVSKPGQTRLTAPVAPKPVVQPVAPAAAGVGGPKKPVSSRHGFKTNESVVYPAHGVGRIVGIEEQEIAGITLELFVIQFEKDKMTLRVPTSKLASVGMRKLAEDGIVKKAMETLKGKARIKRTMWSRRAQEYEAKINSGDLVAIAEVVRDLFRSEAQPEQSYSERQLYEAALDRMAREIAAVDKVDERGAMQRITEVLSKSAKGRRAAEDEAAAEEAADAEVKAA